MDERKQTDRHEKKSWKKKADGTGRTQEKEKAGIKECRQAGRRKARRKKRKQTDRHWKSKLEKMKTDRQAV